MLTKVKQLSHGIYNISAEIFLLSLLVRLLLKLRSRAQNTLVIEAVFLKTSLPRLETPYTNIVLGKIRLLAGGLYFTILYIEGLKSKDQLYRIERYLTSITTPMGIIIFKSSKLENRNNSAYTNPPARQAVA